MKTHIPGLRMGAALTFPGLRLVLEHVLSSPQPAFVDGVAMLGVKLLIVAGMEGLLVEVCSRVELAAYCAETAVWCDPRWSGALRDGVARILAATTELPILVLGHQPPCMLLLVGEEDLASLGLVPRGSA